MLLLPERHLNLTFFEHLVLNIAPLILQPGTAPRARNKMDSLIFLPDTVKAVSDLQQAKKETPVEEPEVEVQVENVERPVDLYKVRSV